MANRYWVGGTGTWDGTAGTKWSDTSGGTGGASVPTSADDVFFDSASGASVVTISAGNTGAKTVTCTGFTGTITGSTGLTVAGSITLAASMTFTPSATWTISGTGTITSAGKTFNALTINGVGITVSLGDNLLMTNALNVTQGTFDTTANNYSITASSITSSNTNTRTINLNGSTVNLNITTTAINFSTATNLTFNAGTSQINLTGLGPTLAGGGQTFYNVSFTNNSGSVCEITGVNTFNNLTLTSPGTFGVTALELSGNQTINGTLTCAGATPTRRLILASSTIGTTRTLTVATLSAQDCDFRDITIAGGAVGSSPTRAGNCGNNSGITFPAAKTVYWNLGGSVDIYSTGWALTSNGTPNADNFPLAQDTATFTNDGLAGTIRFTGGFNIGALNASARTTAATFNFSGSNIQYYGSFTLGSGITLTGSTTQAFCGGGVMVFTSAGKYIPFDVEITCPPTGTFQLGDDFNGLFIDPNSGTFDTNNKNVTVIAWFGGGGSTATLIPGNSTFTLTGGSGTVWAIGSGFTITAPIVLINLTNTNATAITFQTGGFTYNTVRISGATGVGTYAISGVGTIGTLSSTKPVAHTISFDSNITINNWDVRGTVGNVVTVNSNEVGTQRTITYGGGRLILDYMSFTDINMSYPLGASNPYIVYAGVNSTNGGNNDGIAFIDGTTKKAYRLTTGTTWTVPRDWTNTNNIYLIGAGGGSATAAVSGNNRAAGGGGGGGGYTAITNFSATAGSLIAYTVGSSAGNANGGDTTWNSGASIAGGGLKGVALSTPTSSGGAGGTGDFAGGTGGAGAFGTTASQGYGGGGGGGAGGPNGVGGNGGNGFASTTTLNVSGGGGGGNGGGSNGANGTSALGGNGGNNFNGNGGGAGTAGFVDGIDGTRGGGGGGSSQTTNGVPGGAGGSGIDIQNTLGGGGGRAGSVSNVLNTGKYGGGGGGAYVTTVGAAGTGSAGSQGVIFIVYEYAQVLLHLSGITLSGMTLRSQP